MKLDIQKLPKSQLEITVELEAQEVEKYFDQTAKTLSRDMKISGFRPGHVPTKVVIQNVGLEAFWQEAGHEAMAKTYVKIVLDNKIDAIGHPEIQIVKIAPSNPFIYKAKVTVLPEIKLPDYKKIKVKKQKVKTDQKEVERLLVNLQKSRAQVKIVDREARKGDEIEVNFKTYLNKVPIDRGQAQGHRLVLGEAKFVPGFEDKLIGARARDKKEFTLHFPKDYYQKNLADHDIEFSVEVKQVNERILPKIDDNFAKALGKFKDLADLTGKMEQNLKAEAEHKEKDRLDMEIMDKISEKADFELPEALVIGEIEKMMGEMRDMVLASGGEFSKYLEHIKKTEEDLKKEFHSKAEKRVKMGLVLREIAKVEKIFASSEEIKKEQEHTLGHYQHDPEMIKKIQSHEHEDYLASLIQNRKVFEFLEKNLSS